MKTTSTSKIDRGEQRAYEIEYPEFWRLKETMPHICDVFGAHKRYTFKDCTVYETASADRTILMRINHVDGEMKK